MHTHVYIYIYICTYALNQRSVIGWSNNHFNNLHVKISLETHNKATRAAETSLTCCAFVQKWVVDIIAKSVHES